jgi:hypothetical protein
MSAVSYLTRPGASREPRTRVTSLM